MDGVIVYDNGKLTVIRTNPAASAILGFEAIGMRCDAVLDELHLIGGPGRSVIQRVLAGEKCVHLEQRSADETFETSTVPMCDAARQIIGAVTGIRDITEKKCAGQRVQQAQKLESIALLAGGIAHDFNNILTVVGGNISLALENACADCEANSGLPGSAGIGKTRGWSYTATAGLRR